MKKKKMGNFIDDESDLIDSNDPYDSNDSESF